LQDAWIRRVVEDCRRDRFVRTLGGRRRYLPDIAEAADRGRRARAERQAINSTVQGSAADLCKAAMVALGARASAAFEGRPKACRLILQVIGVRVQSWHHHLLSQATATLWPSP
jgi:DNA polymerase I-like protein with 3'-5' exonuclease and polymerase domains